MSYQADAGTGELVRRVERMLDVRHVADDAVGAANLDSCVILRTAGAGPHERGPARYPNHQEQPRRSTKNEHQFPTKT